MNAKAYLHKISGLDTKVRNKVEEIQRLREIATRATSTLSLDGVRGSGYSDKVGDAVCNYVTAEEELQQDIYNAMQYRRSMIRVIEQLPAAEYDLLHKVYAQGMTLQDVADIHNKTYTWATTTHYRALKKLQKILDERECAS